MAYVNTGNQRASSLTVIKYNNGSSIGTPQTFSMLQQFQNSGENPYPVLTPDELRRLPSLDYQDRAAAFVVWVKTNNSSNMPGLGNPAASPANIYYDAMIMVP